MQTRRPFTSPRRAPILATAAAAAAAAVALLTPTLRANETWDGGGANFADTNFSNPANWAFDTLPPNDGTANLVFTGSTNITPSVDTNWSVNSVTFNSAPDGFILHGPSTLTVGAGGITNNTAAVQGFTALVATSTSTTFNAPIASLSFDTVTLANKSTLTFNATAPQSSVALLSGSGSLTKTGAGGLTLGGLSPNTYTGATTVNGGLLFLTKPAKTIAVPGPLTVNLSGTVRLNANAQISDAAPITLNAGTLDLATFTQSTTSPLSMTAGSINGTGTLNLLADLSTGPAGLSSTISSALNLGNADRTFTVADGPARYDLDIDGPITNFNGVVTKTGPGTLRLSGTSSNAVNFNVNQGALLLDKTSGLDTGGDITLSGSGSLSATHDNAVNANSTVTLATSGSFAVGSTAMRSLNVTAVGSFGPGTYTLYNSVGNALTLGPGVSLPNSLALGSPAGGGILYAGSPASPAPSSVGGAIDLGNATRAVSVQATSSGSTHDDLTLAGPISNGGLRVSTPGFDGSNFGALALTAPNSHAGGTSVTNTVLHVSADANLGAPTGPLNLSNAVLRTSASFSTARPVTLDSTAGLYPDAGTTLTLTGPLAGPGPLVVSSPGTLVLPASASLTGGISVSAATLVPTGPASLGTGPLTLSSGTFRPAGASPISFPNPLTLRSSPLNPALFDGPDTTFTGPVTLAFPSVVAVNNNLTLAGAIGDNAAAYGLTKRGTGTLTLTSHNSFTGTLTIEQGAVTLPALSANGSVDNFATLNAGGFTATLATLNNYATLNLIGGELTVSAFNNFAPATLPPNFTLYSYAPGGAGIDNHSTLTLDNATLAATTPVLNQGTLTGLGLIQASSFTNTGQLTPTGPLALTSFSPLSNTGSIDLPLGGQLTLNTLLNSSGTITLAGGAIAGTAPLTLTPGSVLAGHGTLAVTMLNNGTIAPSGGTLYVSTSFVNAGLIQLSSLTGSLTGPGTLANTGTLQGAGSVGNPLANGSTGVIEALGGTLSLPNLTTNDGLLAAPAGGKLLVPGLSANNGTVSLTGGTLDTNAHPLTNAGSITGFGTLRASALTNNSTITLTGGLATVNAALTNSPGATVQVLYNPALFTAPVTNNGTFTITNTTATFAAGLAGSAPNTPSAPAALALSPQSSALSPAPSLAGTLAVTASASSLANYVRQDAVTSAGAIAIRPTSQGGGTSAINALTLSPGSSLDLADTRLILSSSATPPATLRSYLSSARLFSSTAANDPQHLLALGYLDNALLNATAWGGLPADPSNLLVTLTLTGDANLDGQLNADDYALLDKGFAQHASTWAFGDFNYDGTVTTADYLLIDRTFTLQSGTYAPSATLLSTRESQFGPAYVSELIATVPEPSSLSAACGLALPLLRRRRP